MPECGAIVPEPADDHWGINPFSKAFHRP